MSAIILRRTIPKGAFPMSEIRPQVPKITAETSVFAVMEDWKRNHAEQAHKWRDRESEPHIVTEGKKE